MIIQNGKRIDGCSDTVPVGTLQPFAGLTPPKGYLLCQGQLVSKTTYSKLYEICGDMFGSGTNTEFRLPDLRGKTIAGYDENDTAMNTIGKLLGQKTHVHTTGNHTLTEAEMPEHKHLVWANLQSSRLNGSPAWNTVVTANDEGTGITGGNIGTQKWSNSTNNAQLYIHDYSDLTGGSQPHNHGDTGTASNYQPTITMNWIIKAFMLIPEYFIVENTLSSNSTENALSAAQGKILNEKFANYLPLTGTASKARADASGHVFENYYGRINDTITITFSSEGDTSVTLPSTYWGHIALPFNKTLTNTNTSLYSLNSSTGYITIKEAGYYLFSGTANSDTTMNWSLVLSCYSSVINDTMQNAGMINCWLSPVALFIDANTEVALMVRGGESSGVLRFRPDRSYFTITRIK